MFKKNKMNIFLAILWGIALLLFLKMYLLNNVASDKVGISFGEKISSLKVLSENKDRMGNVNYYFIDPGDKYKGEGLSYIVQATQKSKEVYSIYTVENIKGGEKECHAMRKEREKDIPQDFQYNRNEYEDMNIYSSKFLTVSYTCYDIKNELVVNYISHSHYGKNLKEIEEEKEKEL